MKRCNPPSRGNRVRGHRVAIVLAAASLVASAAVWLAPVGSVLINGNALADSVDDGLANAQALYDQGKFKEALAAVNAVLAKDPNSFQAKSLKSQIQKRLAEQGTTTTKPVEPVKEKKIEPLTLGDISHIKLAEMTDADFGKKNLAGSIPRKDLEEFWKKYVLPDRTIASDKDAKADFFRPENLAAQLKLIRDKEANETIDKLRITSEPDFMATFVVKVQPLAITACASCHNGKNAAEMPLIGTSKRPPARESYTNFYVLSMSRGSDGAYVIDRNTPEQSLLVQYLIIPENARAHHPGKVKMARAFKDLDDPNIKDILAWIKSLQVPIPAYGVKFTVPAAKVPDATTQP